MGLRNMTVAQFSDMLDVLTDLHDAAKVLEAGGRNPCLSAAPGEIPRVWPTWTMPPIDDEPVAEGARTIPWPEFVERTWPTEEVILAAPAPAVDAPDVELDAPEEEIVAWMEQASFEASQPTAASEEQEDAVGEVRGEPALEEPTAQPDLVVEPLAEELDPIVVEPVEEPASEPVQPPAPRRNQTKADHPAILHRMDSGMLASAIAEELGLFPQGVSGVMQAERMRRAKADKLVKRDPAPTPKGAATPKPSAVAAGPKIPADKGWEPDDDVLLMEMMQEGSDPAHIADTFGFSIGVCRARKDAIRSAFDGGTSMEVIVEALRERAKGEVQAA